MQGSFFCVMLSYSYAKNFRFDKTFCLYFYFDCYGFHLYTHLLLLFSDWDDPYYLSFSGIRSFDLREIFSSIVVNNYFPFVLLGMAVDFAVCGDNPFCTHFTAGSPAEPGSAFIF